MEDIRWIVCQIQNIWRTINKIKTKGIESILPGSNITINNTDPKNPIISATCCEEELGNDNGLWDFSEIVPNPNNRNTIKL